MEMWLFIALVLFIVAGVTAAVQRAYVVALISAGLACAVLPAAWAAIH